MSKGKFATSINCMDGRVQIPVIKWLKKNFKVDYVDTITEPGPDKILAEERDKILIGSIKRRVEISIKKHGSKIIAIVGHYDCAGNPVEKDIHIKQILFAIKRIKSWGFKTKIIGLWVDERWRVHKITR